MNTATALRDIYGFRANTQKARFYTVFSFVFKVPMIVTTVDAKHHAFRRRILSQAVTTGAISEMEDTLLSKTRLFCQYLLANQPSADGNTARNMTEWMAYLTSDIMGEITFSSDWDTMQNPKNRPILTLVSQGVAALTLVSEDLIHS